jgi:hypothetical protein
MQIARTVRAADPLRFGRGPARIVAAPPSPSTISADLRLFATTFIAGFLFVSMIIA